MDSEKINEQSTARVLEERLSLREFREVLSAIQEKSIALSRVQQACLCIEALPEPITCHPDSTYLRTLDGMPYGADGAAAVSRAESRRSLGLCVDWLLTPGLRQPLSTPEQWLAARVSRDYSAPLRLLLDQLVLVPENARLEAKSDAFLVPDEDEGDKQKPQKQQQQQQQPRQRGRGRPVLGFVAAVLGALVLGFAVGLAWPQNGAHVEPSRELHRTIQQLSSQVVQMEREQRTVQALTLSRVIREMHRQGVIGQFAWSSDMDVDGALFHLVTQVATRMIETEEQVSRLREQLNAVAHQNVQLKKQLQGARNAAEMRSQLQQMAEHQAQLQQQLRSQQTARTLENEQFAELVTEFQRSLAKHHLIRAPVSGQSVQRVLEEIVNELSHTLEVVKQGVRDARQDYDGCHQHVTRDLLPQLQSCQTERSELQSELRQLVHEAEQNEHRRRHHNCRHHHR